MVADINSSFDNSFLDIDKFMVLMYSENIKQAGAAHFSGGQFFLGLIIGGIGIFNLLNPETGAYLSKGWKYKDTEPSDAYVEYTRVGGIIGCIISIVLIFSSCS